MTGRGPGPGYPGNLDLQALRREYPLRVITKDDLAGDPLEHFERWLADAIAAGIEEPNAVTLATADANGHPSARVVLLKQVDARGFLFATHYASRKARELEENPYAALVFHWQPLHRQVRVEGHVARATPAESDAIYRRRPRGARIGAWASTQSAALPDRAALERRVDEFDRRFPGEDVPRPEHWGAFRLVPTTIEFWSGRPDRLHDRLLFRSGAGGDWDVSRLAP